MPFVLPEDRDSLIILAKTAEQCERFEEMLVCMKKVIQLDPILSLEEKNLLSVAYKNLLGARRTPFRNLAILANKADRTSPNYDLIVQFKSRIEAEIVEICNDIFSVLTQQLMPAVHDDDESKVFYLKMKADYHRYNVEVTESSEQTQFALETYQQAMTFAQSLRLSSPVRLGLALNFAVFYYEIKKMPDIGYDLAKKTFEEALPALEGLGDDDYREAATIMSLLRENLGSWQEAMAQATGGPDEGMAVEDV